jgi:hypothetical protein
MIRKRSINNGQDQSESNKRLGRAMTFLENGRGMIKEKRVKTRSKEVKGGC